MEQKKPFNQTDYLDEYCKQDKRLSKARTEIIANNRGINFERLMGIGRGVREIHTITIYGQEIPIRVLSMREERLCKQQTYVAMKSFPEFPPDSEDYAIEFNKTLLRKMVSMSTSSCPEFPQDAFLREVDLEEMPAMTFAELLNKYRAFEIEYNPELNQLDEQQINILIGELRDPSKKYQLLTGMTLSQHVAVTSRLLEMLNGREDNIAILTSLEDSNLTKTTELV